MVSLCSKQETVGSSIWAFEALVQQGGMTNPGASDIGL